MCGEKRESVKTGKTEAILNVQWVKMHGVLPLPAQQRDEVLRRGHRDPFVCPQRQ